MVGPQVLFLLAAPERVPLSATPPRGNPGLLSATQQWLTVRTDTAPFLPTDPSLGWETPLHSTICDWIVGSSGPVQPSGPATLSSTGHWKFARLSTRRSREMFGYHIPFSWFFLRPFRFNVGAIAEDWRIKTPGLPPGDYLIPVLVLSCPP